MIPSSRSVSSSMAWSSSARSAAGHSTSSDKSPDTDALMVASGVRRSCETARSRPVRNSSTAVRRSAVSASCCEARVRSPATNWLPNELTRRRSSALRAVPMTTSRFAASRSTTTGPAAPSPEPDLGSAGSTPAAAVTCQVSPERVSSRAAVAPSASRRCSSTAGTGSASVTSDADDRASASASARARCASSERRVATPTIVLTVTAAVEEHDERHDVIGVVDPQRARWAR